MAKATFEHRDGGKVQDGKTLPDYTKQDMVNLIAKQAFVKSISYDNTGAAIVRTEMGMWRVED